jgi:hypothetical protein
VTQPSYLGQLQVLSRLPQGWLRVVAAGNRFGLGRKGCNRSWTGLGASDSKSGRLIQQLMRAVLRVVTARISRLI